MPTATSLQSAGYALLVGVEKYDDLPEDKQLLSGRNDVLAFWKVCRRLGFEPRNIRVLTSPMLDEQDLVWAEQELGPELTEYKGKSEVEIETMVKGWFSEIRRAEATRDALVGELQELAKRRSPHSDGPANRLFTYSGHGARKGGELALCPRDVGANLAGAVTFGNLSEILNDVDDSLTIVLDCCFAQSSGQRRADRRTAYLDAGISSDSQRSTDPPRSKLAARVLCASGPDQQSSQAMLGGYWYGAFTWALTVALEQWTIVSEGKGGSKRSTISYGELRDRATALLEALSFPQKPALLREEEIGTLAAFHHGSEGHPGEVDEDPNAKRLGGQVDPSTKGWAYYEFREYTPIGDVVARVIVTNTASTEYDMSGRTEYWQIEGDAFNPTDQGSLTVTKTVHEWSPSDPPPFGAGKEKDKKILIRSVDVTPWTSTNLKDQTVYTVYIGETRTGWAFDAHAGCVRWDGTKWTGRLTFYRVGRETRNLFASENALNTKYSFALDRGFSSLDTTASMYSDTLS